MRRCGCEVLNYGEEVGSGALYATPSTYHFCDNHGYKTKVNELVDELWRTLKENVDGNVSLLGSLSQNSSIMNETIQFEFFSLSLPTHLVVHQ